MSLWWSESDQDRIRDKFKILFEAYRKMLGQSFSKSKDLGNMLRFLPGVVVQNLQMHMSMQGMADLYRIEPDVLERLFKSTTQPLKRFPHFCFMLVCFLAGPRPFSALLLRSHTSTYFYLPSFLIFPECFQRL